MDTQRVKWVQVWTHRGWGGYMDGHLEGGYYRYRYMEGRVETCMDTWSELGGYKYGHIEGKLSTGTDT